MIRDRGMIRAGFSCSPVVSLVFVSFACAAAQANDTKTSETTGEQEKPARIMPLSRIIRPPWSGSAGAGCERVPSPQSSPPRSSD